MKIAIIGGGAAGCFAAIQIKDRQPDAEVHVWEAGRKALAKVAVTGGRFHRAGLPPGQQTDEAAAESV